VLVLLMCSWIDGDTEACSVMVKDRHNRKGFGQISLNNIPQGKGNKDKRLLIRFLKVQYIDVVIVMTISLTVRTLV